MATNCDARHLCNQKAGHENRPLIIDIEMYNKKKKKKKCLEATGSQARDEAVRQMIDYWHAVNVGWL